jgi:hypothetical protein
LFGGHGMPSCRLAITRAARSGISGQVRVCRPTSRRLPQASRLASSSSAILPSSLAPPSIQSIKSSSGWCPTRTPSQARCTRRSGASADSPKCPASSWRNDLGELHAENSLGSRACERSRRSTGCLFRHTTSFLRSCSLESAQPSLGRGKAEVWSAEHESGNRRSSDSRRLGPSGLAVPRSLPTTQIVLGTGDCRDPPIEVHVREGLCALGAVSGRPALISGCVRAQGAVSRALSPNASRGGPPPFLQTDGPGAAIRRRPRRPGLKSLPRSSRICPANDRETVRSDGNGRSIESAGQVSDSPIAAGSEIGPENTLNVKNVTGPDGRMQSTARTRDVRKWRDRAAARAYGP